MIASWLSPQLGGVVLQVVLRVPRRARPGERRVGADLGPFAQAAQLADVMLEDVGGLAAHLGQLRQRTVDLLDEVAERVGGGAFERTARLAVVGESRELVDDRAGLVGEGAEEVAVARNSDGSPLTGEPSTSGKMVVQVVMMSRRSTIGWAGGRAGRIRGSRR